jgi:hypothetical protein
LTLGKAADHSQRVKVALIPDHLAVRPARHRQRRTPGGGAAHRGAARQAARAARRRRDERDQRDDERQRRRLARQIDRPARRRQAPPRLALRAGSAAPPRWRRDWGGIRAPVARRRGHRAREEPLAVGAAPTLVPLAVALEAATRAAEQHQATAVTAERRGHVVGRRRHLFLWHRAAHDSSACRLGRCPRPSALRPPVPTTCARAGRSACHARDRAGGSAWFLGRLLALALLDAGWKVDGRRSRRSRVVGSAARSRLRSRCRSRSPAPPSAPTPRRSRTPYGVRPLSVGPEWARAQAGSPLHGAQSRRGRPRKA